jgi:hypothetical protein
MQPPARAPAFPLAPEAQPHRPARSILGPTLASQKSKRRSRKRRSPAAATRPSPAPRPQRRAERRREAVGERARTTSQIGTRGERPPSPFGGLPVSEFAILAGIVALVVGLLEGGGPAVIVGTIVCVLGVIEVTAREHFAGYRSHTILLAGIPAVGVEVGLVAAFGEPRQRALLLLVVVPVFAVLLWLLKRRFETARQARMVRPPAP